MAIRGLSEFEHIQLCPGNYMGSTENPTHLLYELIDNSADECLTGNSNFLAVIMDLDNNKYTVVDKGRGIPIKSPDFKEDAPIVIATKLFTGGKFDNDLYQHRSGLHGEGLVIVNALSTSFEIITKNGNQHRHYIFNGTDVTKKDVDKKQFSTSVSFAPNEKHFETVFIDPELIENRLKSILVYDNEDKIEMLLIVMKDNNVISKKITNTIVKEFETECSKYLTTTIQNKKDELRLYVGYTNEGSKYKKFKGVINTLNVDQGTHQKMIETIVKDYLYEKAVKAKLHVNKEDVLIGGRLMAILKITNPAFAGQTKYSLNMRESDIEHIINKNSIIKFLENDQTFVMNWLALAQEYRIELDTKKQTKTRKSRNVVMVEDLKDCTSANVDERELFLLEGQSAGGTLQLARDINIHALLPLRGKVLNVLNADKKKILNSKTLMNIFTAINVKPFTTDLSGLRYGKVNIMCFTGDTKVKMLNGENKTFEELVEMEKINPGRDYWVYSIDEHGNYVPGKAYSPRVTSYVDELLHITIDDEYVIKCTPTHKFLLRDHTQIEAKDLQPDMSLMPLYFHMFQQDGLQYEYMKRNVDETKQYRTHRIMANQTNELFSELVCHHKDSNTLNNEPSNLEWMTKEEHDTYHINRYNALNVHGERISYLHRETDTYQNTGIHLTEYNYSEKNKETTRQLNRREDVKLLQKKGRIIKCVCKLLLENLEFNEINFNNWRSNGTPFYEKLLQYFDSYDEILRKAIQNKDKYNLNDYKVQVLYDKTKKARNSIARIVKKILDNNEPVIGPYYEEYRTSRSDPKWKNVLNYYDSIDEMIEYAKTYNHKVTCVERKKLNVLVPVYNLTVDKYHNYAIVQDIEKEGIVKQNAIVVQNCDGDVDGKHIAALLISMFDHCLPNIINEGYLHVVETPLFGYYNKKQFIPIYDETELDSLKEKKIQIFRYKGLGEMEPNELAVCALNPQYRKLIQVIRVDGQITVNDVWNNRSSLINEYFAGD